jgi:hypothetical protein
MKRYTAEFLSLGVVDVLNFSLFNLVLLSTAFRVVSRQFLVPKIGLDDILAVVAAAFALAYIIVIHFEYDCWERLYITVKDVPAAEADFSSPYQAHWFSNGLRLAIFDNVTQLLSLSFAKLSLVAFYRRITTHRRSHRIALDIITAIIVGNAISQVLVLFFSTKPVKCNYDYEHYQSTCTWVVNTLQLLIVNGAVQILIDLCCIIMPWVVLRELHTSRQTKVKLVSMYSVGCITLSFSAIRMWAVNNGGLDWKQWLNSQFPFEFWSLIEAFAAILCINIPALVAGGTKLYSLRYGSKRHVPQVPLANKWSQGSDSSKWNSQKDTVVSKPSISELGSPTSHVFVDTTIETNEAGKDLEMGPLGRQDRF